MGATASKQGAISPPSSSSSSYTSSAAAASPCPSYASFAEEHDAKDVDGDAAAAAGAGSLTSSGFVFSQSALKGGIVEQSYHNSVNSDTDEGIIIVSPGNEEGRQAGQNDLNQRHEEDDKLVKDLRKLPRGCINIQKIINDSKGQKNDEMRNQLIMKEWQENSTEKSTPFSKLSTESTPTPSSTSSASILSATPPSSSGNLLVKAKLIISGSKDTSSSTERNQVDYDDDDFSPWSATSMIKNIVIPDDDCISNQIEKKGIRNSDNTTFENEVCTSSGSRRSASDLYERSPASLYSGRRTTEMYIIENIRRKRIKVTNGMVLIEKSMMSCESMTRKMYKVLQSQHDLFEKSLSMLMKIKKSRKALRKPLSSSPILALRVLPALRIFSPQTSIKCDGSDDNSDDEIGFASSETRSKSWVRTSMVSFDGVVGGLQDDMQKVSKSVESLLELFSQACTLVDGIESSS